MKATVVASTEYTYPDIWEYATASNGINLNTAQNAMPSAQVLLSGVPGGAGVRVEAQGGIAGMKIEMYELVPVFVECTPSIRWMDRPKCAENLKPAQDCPARWAPFSVYDCIKPLGDALSPKDGAAGLYFCFNIAADCPAGIAEGSLKITVGGEKIEIPVCVRVFPVRIPEEEHLKIYNFYNISHTATYHQLKTGSPEHEKMHTEYKKMFRRMKQNMIHVTPAAITQEGEGKYAFDFTPMKEDIESLLHLGYKYFALGLGGRKSWKESTIYVHDLPAMSYEAYVFMSQYLPALNEHILKNGWKGQIITSVSDEPNEINATEYRALCGLVRKLAPDLILHDAVSYVPIHGALDIWVPLGEEYCKHQKEFESFRGKGGELWHYVCCRPRDRYLNRMMDYPLLSTRYLFWGNYAYNLTGFLHWGGNHYQPGQDPYTCSCPLHTNADSGLQLPPGDTHIVYPGQGAPWASMRLEAHRQSVEDYELLLLLSKKDKQAADALCKKCFRSFNDVTYDPNAFEGVREELLSRLCK